MSMFSPVWRPSGTLIFVAFGLPYLLVVVMAFVGARLVYSLGRGWAKSGRRAIGCLPGRRRSS
jgi:hypothetical protein